MELPAGVGAAAAQIAVVHPSAGAGGDGVQDQRATSRSGTRGTGTWCRRATTATMSSSRKTKNEPHVDRLRVHGFRNGEGMTMDEEI